MLIRILEGLNIPMSGAPKPTVSQAPETRDVALSGRDYIGLSPAMKVHVGDRVKLGQAIFSDKNNPDVIYTAPGSGIVDQINRGKRRSLLSVVIRLDGDDSIEFDCWAVGELPHLSRQQVTDQLLASGLWASLRTRPYSKVPHPDVLPHSLFVTAIDSNPLATPPMWVINKYKEAYTNGLWVISHLTEGPVYVCQSYLEDLPQIDCEKVVTTQFAGPHPSGNVGTHIHFLDPVGGNKSVWHLNYQDVISIGHLFTTGKIMSERIVALSGPRVKAPRLLKTRIGADIFALTQGELGTGASRLISGSVLSGRWVKETERFLGRYHNQITVIPEATANSLRDSIVADQSTYSVFGIQPADYGHGKILSQGEKGRTYPFTTSLNGKPEALVPMGAFEQVMPLDILPTPLLRALLVGDTDMGQALGCLELDEEDLALCTFVCTSKLNYGAMLRAALERIERDG